MDDSGFIVPPPGLIPPRPPQDRAPADAAAPVRPLPAFAPPAAPGAPVAPARPVWRLILPGGGSVPVTRTVVLGRNPSGTGQPADAELIALDDPTSTVSKTHAAITATGDALEVVDLHSTNGVVVAGGRIEPGRPHPIPAGADVLLGDLRVQAERS